MGRRATQFAVIAAAAALVGLLSYGLATQAPDRTIDDALAAGQAAQAPSFTLDVLTTGSEDVPVPDGFRRAAEDGRVSLSELRGTPMVINFWASWCTPCVDEAPVLAEGWTAASKSGVLFLGINQQDIREQARKFVARHALAFPHIRDPTNETSRSFGATGLPETFFIDGRGRVVGHIIGAVERDELELGIEAARSGQVVAPAAGGSVQRLD